MESPQLKRMNEKIQELYDAMVTILPLGSIGEHPFDHFRMVTEQIIESVETAIEKTIGQRLEIQREINELMDIIERDCRDMELPMLVFPDLCNLSVMREYVRNEASRMALMRRGVGTKILMVIEDIETIRKEMPDVTMQEIGCEDMCLGGEWSLKRLRELEGCRDGLRNKIELREVNRDRLYKELLEFLSLLFKNDPDVRIDQKIFVLERLHTEYKNEVEGRMEEFRRLECGIRRRERYLDMAHREIEADLGDDGLASLRTYDVHLEEEQRRRLDEIYERKKKVLKELLDMFEIETRDYQRTEEEVEEMTRMIEVLESKKDLFLSITSLISKRTELIEKMNEFEKIASDPRRLFRSSFQLLSEEKFRNNAYPNLIKIEEAIFRLLDEFESRFGEFVKDGANYKESLTHEVENRIVNKTVFINRFDSPVKKRR